MQLLAGAATGGGHWRCVMNPDVVDAGVALAAFALVALVVWLLPPRFTRPRPVLPRGVPTEFRDCFLCGGVRVCAVHRDASYTCLTCWTSYHPEIIK